MERIHLLLETPRLYEQLRIARPRLQKQFYDARDFLFAARLKIIDDFEAYSIQRNGTEAAASVPRYHE